MHFDLIQSLGIAGDPLGANDDRAGSSDRLAWIIDGATDLGPPGLVGTRGGAAWLALTADSAFAAAAHGPLPHVTAGVFDRLAAAFAAERRREAEGGWEHPSAAFLVVSLVDDALEIAWLADCAAFVLSGDAITRIGPQPSEAETSAARDAGAAGITLAAKKREDALTNQLRGQRERPDRRILGIDPGNAAHVQHGRTPIGVGDEILLMTDGFAALVDDYGMVPTAFRDLLRRDGLPALATALRAIEREDAACIRFPRFKPSDDATALWLRVAA